jgi:hypothetical protein
LIAQVTKVMEPADFGEGGTVAVWWHVEAVCRHPAESARPGQPRELYIRADRLATALRPTTGR